ncbi:MAG: T9SS type A sorting domain-containing protein [Saprospiraceae bacterium]|nr:T9SS type A sorting domain-containing protein [Saprospiraceae bacterium]
MNAIKKATILLVLVLWAVAGLFGQKLIEYLPVAAKKGLDKKQSHYYEVAKSWRFATGSRLATVDVRQFLNDTVVFNFNNATFTAVKQQRHTPFDLERKSWVGKFVGIGGEVHVVFKENEMVGFVQFDDFAFLIRPLGKGIHAVLDWDMTMDDGCKTPDTESFEFQGDTDAAKRKQYDLPDLRQKDQSKLQPGQAATGECNVRVLVAYTDDVDAAVPDVLMDIVNMVNLANTGYINSSTGADAFEMSMELATAFEVNYAETSDIDDDLDAFTDTGDGILDGIHAQRQLWDADQCVLLTTTGTGLGWISTDYEDQFSVTGQGNFYALTFHHETGHNAGCTHATTQATEPGTSPWAAWGEPTTGCFRTVMAYQDACGMNPCPRQNIFSDDDANSWTCGGTNYTPGDIDHRNQDRITQSAPIVVNHEVVSNDVTFTDDYNWQAREAVHVAANNTLAYASPTNQFEFHPSSLGSFRASNRVTLGRGFVARSGSSFRAYLESCTSIAPLTGGDTESRSGEPVAEVGNADGFSLQVQPNPFSTVGDVVYEVPEEDKVEITLWSETGQLVQTIVAAQLHPAGKFNTPLQQFGIPPGFYIMKMTFGKQQKFLKVVRS